MTMDNFEIFLKSEKKILLNRTNFLLSADNFVDVFMRKKSKTVMHQLSKSFCYPDKNRVKKKQGKLP